MDYSLESIKEWACNLIIMQYRNSLKNREFIKLLVELIFANNILLRIRDGFNIDSAVGIQLDIIGAWVGIDRFYNYVDYPYRPWFSLIDWNKEPDTNLQGGFSTYENFDDENGGFVTYQDILYEKRRLNDADFRKIINLKIIKNNLYMTCKNIDDAIWNFFDQDVYTTWNKKNLIYKYNNNIADFIKICESKNVLPCPTGMKVVLEEIIND